MKRDITDKQVRQDSLMHDLIDEMGGAAAVATRMHERRGRQPMTIALEIIGGQSGLARLLGMTPQGVSKLLLKDIGDWPSRYLHLIESETKIPIQTLLLDRTPLRGGRDNAER